MAGSPGSADFELGSVVKRGRGFSLEAKSPETDEVHADHLVLLRATARLVGAAVGMASAAPRRAFARVQDSIWCILEGGPFSHTGRCWAPRGVISAWGEEENLLEKSCKVQSKAWV